MNIDTSLGTYIVIIDEHDNGNFGDCIRETWTKDGVVHRVDAPAVIYRSIETDRIIQEEWYHHGLLHRIGDKPARIYQNQSINILEWFEDGAAHRIGKPAIYETNARGEISREEWFVYGDQHRENYPALIIRDTETEIIHFEAWYESNELHRVGGAAQIERDPITGIITEEFWFQRGKPFRENDKVDYVVRHGDTGEIIESTSSVDILNEIPKSQNNEP